MDELNDVKKESIWERFKKWIVGGVAGVAIVAGGITVGVNPEHKDGTLYVIDPITKDSLWFTDTLEAKLCADSLAMIRVSSEKVITTEKTVQQTVKIAIDEVGGTKDSVVDVKLPAVVERAQARLNFDMVKDADAFAEVGDVYSAQLYKNGKLIGQLYYKCEVKAADGAKIMVLLKMIPIEMR